MGRVLLGEEIGRRWAVGGGGSLDSVGMSTPSPVSPRRPLRVLLVDDQALVRAGFGMILGTHPDTEVVGECGDGQEAVEWVAAHPGGVDVVVMDIRMPRLDGVAATRQIRALPDAPAVLLLTTFDLDEYVVEGLAAGAGGFLLKDTEPNELIAGIMQVSQGNSVIAPTATRRLVDRALPLLLQNTTPGGAGPDAPPTPETPAALTPPEALTAREVEVLTLIGQGMSNTQIAQELFVAETTVKTHVGHLFDKLGTRERVHLVIAAYDAGLVSPRTIRKPTSTVTQRSPSPLPTKPSAMDPPSRSVNSTTSS